MSSITTLARAYEEFVSLPFAIPGGRLVTAKLSVVPFLPAGTTPAEGDTLQLVVEVRNTPDGQFEPVASSAVLSQYAEANAEVEVPGPAEPVPVGERPPVARLRLIHTGALPPRYEVRLHGL